MNRPQLEHIIRASGGIADDTHIVVVGSQAILGEHPQAPAELLVSMEADVYPKHDPERAIVIDGAIGEQSLFHLTYGYYAHGVSPETAVLPAGWQERVVLVRNENTNGWTGECLEAHDLAVSKLAAGREKDVEFVRTMLRQGMVGAELLRSRIALVETVDKERRQWMQQRLQVASPWRGHHW